MKFRPLRLLPALYVYRNEIPALGVTLSGDRECFEVRLGLVVRMLRFVWGRQP